MTFCFNKILYLGAWDHIEVVDYFPNCNEFVLIDTQPRSDFDQKDYFDEELYRHKFIDNIIKKFEKYGFILTDKFELDPNYMNIDLPYINPHLLIFNNKNKIIKYYISTNILFNMTSLLEKDIMESDTLYISGYFPDKELLKYFNKKINFVGDDYTIYHIDSEDEPDNIIINIKYNSTSQSNFNYYVLNRELNKIVKCDNLRDIINNKIK